MKADRSYKSSALRSRVRLGTRRGQAGGPRALEEDGSLRELRGSEAIGRAGVQQVQGEAGAAQGPLAGRLERLSPVGPWTA